MYGLGRQAPLKIQIHKRALWWKRGVVPSNLSPFYQYVSLTLSLAYQLPSANILPPLN